MSDRIFISYSHKDQELFDAFHKELRVALGGEERLEIWADTRIKASDDWHREIQTALEKSTVAVLLVSSDFLDSKYILDQELPLLLRRRLQEQLHLTPFFVKPSVADERDFPVEVPGRGEIRVRITRFQGLNSPREPLSQQSEPDRELQLLHAARTVRDLALRPRQLSSRSDRNQERFELLIDLERRGRSLVRTFSLPDFDRFTSLDEDPIESPEALARWSDSNRPLPPAALFELLFGTEGVDRASRILLDAFQIRDGALPAPTANPLRVRLRTDDPVLRGLPWSRIQWGGQQLRDHGWSVELTPTDGPSGFPELDSVLFRLPAPVLLVLPGVAREERDAMAHHLGLMDYFQRLWPHYARLPLVAFSLDEVSEILEREAPRILYYYGPAVVEKGLCRLLSGDDRPDSDGLTLDALAQLVSGTGMQAVFLNLVGDPAIGAGALAAPLASRLPFVAVQTCPRQDTLPARESFFHWLEAVFPRDYGADPVWALNQYGLHNACAWSRYGRWRTEVSDRRPEPRQAQLVLDRSRQRERTSALLDDLVRDPDLRVCHLLAYGRPGNHTDEFPTQVVKHLKRLAAKPAHVHRRDVTLPASARSERDIDRSFRQVFDIGDRESAAAALQVETRTRGTTPHVPLLVWTLSGRADMARLPELLAGLGRWIVQHLARACPRGLKILSLITLEVAESDLDTVAGLASSLLDEPDLADEAFELETLVRLDHVELNDVKRFIKREGSCPSKLKQELPELIYRETGGQFDKTVELLDRGQTTSWHDLHDQLRAKDSKNWATQAEEDGSARRTEQTKRP
jgi:hypothetical protein